MVLSVSEIVSSISGEGKYTGIPTTFVRLYGCNLCCKFCDTKYASKGKRKRLSIDTILNCVFKMGNKHICITGGEPLLQESVYALIYELVERRYFVTIETNGSVEIPETLYHRSYSYCMDIKCPSSGESNKNNFANLARLMNHDEVKFVVKDREDYEFAKEVLKKYPTEASLIFSPCFESGKPIGAEVSQWILEDKIYKAKIGVQIHKILNIY
ncbi:radical SAM protein [bacterium]|nr:radical SAM protein [bacterium]